ncbi:cerberus [Rhinatrema bivittatum]|uniref:cerberus n=1 Tax=Rhinatrema bivittatum TaxID=194408 RepID=UPI001129593C|nr:cerberus [Rhinatrema bivittatum]
MFLILLQLLLISCLCETRPERDLFRKRRRKALFLPQHDQARAGHKSHSGELLLDDSADYEEIVEQQGLLAFAPSLADALPSIKDSRRGVKEPSRLHFPPMARHVEDAEDWGQPRESFNPEERRSLFPPLLMNERNMVPPYRKNAKKFWNHFTFQKNSASQDLILPIKTTEVLQETCKTLPFSQSIIQENCEETVMQNNLCFGKCSSFHVPGPEDHSYTFCSHCLPSKFTMSQLAMNCTLPSAVVKTVMVVQECKCEVQKGGPLQLGPP